MRGAAFQANIAFVADHVRTTVGTPQFGICHGMRRGKEQEWFVRILVAM